VGPVLNGFADDVMECVCETNVHALQKKENGISGVLFAKDAAISSFTINSYRKPVCEAAKYRTDCNSIYNRYTYARLFS
jgi:hypothetical protein